MSAEDNGELSFEEALSRLEAIVRELEAGRIKLDDAVNAYEQAVGLKNFCEKKLQEAKLKIEKIVVGPDNTPPASTGKSTAFFPFPKATKNA